MDEIKEKNYRERELISIDFFSIAESHIHATAVCKKYAHFRVDHIRRVYKIACRLANGYRGIDYEKIKVMCAIHDMFKYTSTENHGECAAKYLKEFFIDTYFPNDSIEKLEWYNVIEALRHHSDKNMITNNQNAYLAILMDADMLDKIHIQHVTSLRGIFKPQKTIKEVMDECVEEVNGYNGLSIKYETIKSDMRNALVRAIK